jgi:hypothetical protein
MKFEKKKHLEQLDFPFLCFHVFHAAELRHFQITSGLEFELHWTSQHRCAIFYNCTYLLQ